MIFDRFDSCIALKSNIDGENRLARGVGHAGSRRRVILPMNSKPLSRLRADIIRCALYHRRKDVRLLDRPLTASLSGQPSRFSPRKSRPAISGLGLCASFQCQSSGIEALEPDIRLAKRLQPIAGRIEAISRLMEKRKTLGRVSREFGQRTEIPDPRYHTRPLKSLAVVLSLVGIASQQPPGANRTTCPKGSSSRLPTMRDAYIVDLKPTDFHRGRRRAPYSRRSTDFREMCGHPGQAWASSVDKSTSMRRASLRCRPAVNAPPARGSDRGDPHLAALSWKMMKTRGTSSS
jgi:hypothetical protein